MFAVVFNRFKKNLKASFFAHFIRPINIYTVRWYVVAQSTETNDFRQ